MKMEAIFKTIVPRNCFSCMDTIMKSFLLSPPETKFSRKIYSILVPPFFVIISGVLLIGEPLEVFLSDDTVERKLLTVGILSLHIASIARIATWFKIRKEYGQILKSISRSTFEFGIFDVTHDVQMSTEGIIVMEQTEGNVRSPIATYQDTINLRTSVLCSVLFFNFFFYTSLNFVLAYTINYFQDTYEKFNPHLNKTSTYRDFVYPIWLPFDYSVSDGHYLLVFLYEFLGYYLLVGGFVIIDWMFIITIIHLRSQVTIIAFAFSQVDCNISKEDYKSQTILKIRIVKCIQELEIVLGLADKLDNLINITALITFLCSLFVVCCLSYLASVLSTAFHVALFATMFIATLMENFVVCWFYYEFTSEFSIVLRNVYNLDWINYSPSLRRNLVFLMARLQKPPTFTLIRWAKIDMLLFINVVKMASSFYTLISNINKK